MNTTSSGHHGLTEDETDLYDRQIRLWGFEAQQKMKSSKILLVGFSGLNAEICKNLVLAGVHSVTILEHEITKEEDFETHLFLTHEDLGKNRANQSLERIRTLNPLVHVSVDERRIDQVKEDYFLQFSVVCVVNDQPLQSLIWLDELCRKHKIYFFVSGAMGFYGFFFLDLSVYQYTKKYEAENRMETISVSFPSLANALSVKWNTLKRIPPLFYGLLLLGKYFEKYKAYPNADKHGDEEEFLQFSHSILKEQHVEVEDAFLREMVSDRKSVV